MGSKVTDSSAGNNQNQQKEIAKRDRQNSDWERVHQVKGMLP